MGLSKNEITILSQFAGDISNLIQNNSSLKKLLPSIQKQVSILLNTENSYLKDRIYHDIRSEMFAIPIHLFSIQEEKSFGILNEDGTDIIEANDIQYIKNDLFRVQYFVESILYEFGIQQGIHTINLAEFTDLFSKYKKYGVEFKSNNVKEINISKGIIYRYIDNCIRNAHLHGLADKVIIEFKLKNDNLIIEIKDNGSGIDIQPIEQIFEPGFSGGNSTGIGLANIPELLAKIGGSIEVLGHGGVDGGAKFIITIPQ